MACGETLSDSLIVAAIDLGTKFSSYAFSTRSEFKMDPNRVYSSLWQTHSKLSHKEPSCILFDPSKNFDSFGSDAVDKYSLLVLEKEHTDWFFFKWFKMQLHDEKVLRRNFPLKCENGLTMPALDVFLTSIKYLQDHLVNYLVRCGVDISEQEINWVLIVPPNLTDSCEQFYKDVGYMLPKSDLILASEPEAASIYCKHMMTLNPDWRSTLDALSTGAKILVLNAGGETVDITVHEIQQDGNMKLIHMANCGDWAEFKVGQTFAEFIFGQEFMNKFRIKYSEDYYDLLETFRLQTERICPDSTSKITINIPMILIKEFEEKQGISLKDAFQSNKSIYYVPEKVRVDQETAKSFYEETCKQITEHLDGIFHEAPVATTDIILMVGRFSESTMLQKAVKSAFPNKTVIIPEEAGLAVLKGAVQFGFNRKIFNLNICPLSDKIEDFKRKLDSQNEKLQDRNDCDATETSLPDPDRPANISRQFSELFEEEWIEAIAELGGNNKRNIDYLRKIVTKSYLFAKTCAQKYLDNLDNAILQLNSSVQVKDPQISKINKEHRRKIASYLAKDLHEPFVSGSRRYKRCGPRVTSFMKKLVPLCYKMVLHEPPMTLSAPDEGCIDPEIFEPYKECSGKMNYVFWPALYLHEGGAVLCKGIAGGII